MGWPSGSGSTVASSQWPSITTFSLTISTALASSTFVVTALSRPRPDECPLITYCVPSPGADSLVYYLMQGWQKP